ncbi:MEAB protein [Diplocarpon rosae]|nr:MEAB protein [Diplocarpon rosae]
MSTEKKEPREGSDELMDVNSPTPEPDTGAPQDNAGLLKRKGGRKPIYATSEERKQRNRQAQAAFRERRTEYIKQLEETIRVHETNLQSLQKAHRGASDECLMLRYKNSLLERILLEKGIDVQAELRAKTGSPHLGPTHMPNMAQAPNVPRVMMGRHHQARRSNSSIAPKLDLGAPLQSPQPPPTSSSHTASPASHSPGFLLPGAMTPPAPDAQIQFQSQQPRLQASKLQHSQRPPGPSGLGGYAEEMGTSMGTKGQGISGIGPGGGPSAGPTYYPPSAGYQSHKQEDVVQADMVDDKDPAETGRAPYPDPTPPAQPYQQLGNNPGHGQGQGIPQGGEPHGYPAMTQPLMDPFDPLMDMDPFGLSASMQFPTSFSFDTSSMR